MSYENVTIDGTVRIENAPEPPVSVEKSYLKTPYGIINLGILVRTLILQERGLIPSEASRPASEPKDPPPIFLMRCKFASYF